MNDLLQLKSNNARINFNESQATSAVNCINQIDDCQTVGKNHKRPSISSYDQISTKRVRSEQSVDAISNNVKCKSRLNDQLHINSEMMECLSPAARKVDQQQSSILSSPSEYQQSQQQSNSVLMNLLVNGCDVSAGYYTIPIPRQKAAKA